METLCSFIYRPLWTCLHVLKRRMFILLIETSVKTLVDIIIETFVENCVEISVKRLRRVKMRPSWRFSSWRL